MLLDGKEPAAQLFTSVVNQAFDQAYLSWAEAVVAMGCPWLGPRHLVFWSVSLRLLFEVFYFVRSLHFSAVIVDFRVQDTRGG